MNLKVPIEILDELAETVIRSTGSLDLASGEIFDVRYEVDRPGLMGMPAVDEQYEFTSGVLSNDGKDVEFRIEVDVMCGKYFVNPTELLELKVRAAKLFAGLEGKTLLAASERAAAASSDIHVGDADGAFIEATIASVKVTLSSPPGSNARERNERPKAAGRGVRLWATSAGPERLGSTHTRTPEGWKGAQKEPGSGQRLASAAIG